MYHHPACRLLTDHRPERRGRVCGIGSIAMSNRWRGEAKRHRRASLDGIRRYVGNISLGSNTLIDDEPSPGRQLGGRHRVPDRRGDPWPAERAARRARQTRSQIGGADKPQRATGGSHPVRIRERSEPQPPRAPLSPRPRRRRLRCERRPRHLPEPSTSTRSTTPPHPATLIASQAPTAAGRTRRHKVRLKPFTSPADADAAGPTLAARVCRTPSTPLPPREPPAARGATDRYAPTDRRRATR